MTFQKAEPNEFNAIKNFYNNLIDGTVAIRDKIGWKKGVYPTDSFLQNSLSSGELFTLKENNLIIACVILNSARNDGYNGVPWSLNCNANEVLIPHALAVTPMLHGKGIGKKVVDEILKYAKSNCIKTVRLDILATNTMAERLYTKCGFKFVQSKPMFYEDTGWTEYKMYELIL